MSVLQGTVYTAQLTATADLTGTTATATVTAPDGTVATQQAVVDGPTATVSILGTQVGTYLIVWATTGALVGGEQDQFTVVAPTLDLISLPDLREELNLGDTSKDVKLRRWLRAATVVVENVTGPIRPHVEVDRFDGGGFQVVLAYRWVSSVTSVVEGFGATARTLTELGGTGDQSYSYTWDRDTNVITRRGAGGGVARFQSGSLSVAVSYVAGLSTIPDDIQLATAELIKHWYRKSEVAFRGSSAFGSSATDDVSTPGNYMVPNAVMELLEPWRRLPDIA